MAREQYMLTPAEARYLSWWVTFGSLLVVGGGAGLYGIPLRAMSASGLAWVGALVVLRLMTLTEQPQSLPDDHCGLLFEGDDFEDDWVDVSAAVTHAEVEPGRLFQWPGGVETTLRPYQPRCRHHR